MKYTYHTKCRVCGNSEMTPYIDLGLLPLSNNLCNAADEHPYRYPLRVLLCQQCGLSQLDIVVDRDLLFSHYVYRSSINQGYVNHCREMAIELQIKYNLTNKSFVIDIAGNDGALLREFKSQIGCKVLNVDPAKNLYKICEDSGVRMYCTFWGMDAAKHIAANWYQKADIITATNVFAHVDNVKEFIEAAKIVLAPDGKLILEFPYLIDFIENREFDTIYFEHLSYFSIRPLLNLVEDCRLNIESVSRQDIHGGSVRVTIGTGPADYTVRDYIRMETFYRNIDMYKEFELAVSQTIEDFRIQLHSLPGKVAAFAASAKGNTLLNCAGITDKDLVYIVDETPEKIGKYSPGTNIRIVGIGALYNLHNPPEYILILSWNFADEIMAKCRAAGFKGKFIIPIPKWKIIE